MHSCCRRYVLLSNGETFNFLAYISSHFFAGCFHEFCTHCALYLCSTNRCSTVAGPPGSIACPLCRHGIVSFLKLESTMAIVKEVPKTTLSLPFCACSVDGPELSSMDNNTPYCRPEIPLGSSFRSLSCQKFPLIKFSPGLCMGSSPEDTSPSLVPRNSRDQLARCSRLSFRRSTSQSEPRRWLCSFSQSMETASI